MTVASTVDTNERKSTQANSPTQYYTVEDIAETVTGSSTAPTTCIVTIPSAASGEFITYSDGRPNVENGIKGMGSTPIELLPAPGAGLYYEWSVRLEYTHVTTAYTLSDPYIYLDAPFVLISKNLITVGANSYIHLTSSNVDSSESVEGVAYKFPSSLNQSVVLSTYNNTNPTLGDGTLRAIITYTTRTFGA